MKTSTRNALNCCMAVLGKGDETAEIFHEPLGGKISPLFWRVPILLWAICVIVASVASFWGPIYKFLLYMTHWGLVFILVESIFGVVVALKKPGLDVTFGLPWYVKMYWVLYNITIPVAFLVTVFYFTVLKASAKKRNYAPNPVMDFMVHGMNSMVMMVELLCSAHPSKLLHVMQPLYFAGVYMLFSVIYFLADGKDPWGNHFIYPVIDWTKPDQTLLVITLTAVFLGMMHVVVVAISTVRDILARWWLGDSTGLYNDAFGA